MSLHKRLIFIALALVLLLVIGYFVYTGKSLYLYPYTPTEPQVSEGQAL